MICYGCTALMRECVCTLKCKVLFFFFCLYLAVFRKNEFNLYPFYSKKKGGSGSSSLGGVGLTRKPSFGASGGVRPFLHQYEVKGQQSSASTPSDVTDDKVDDTSDQGKHSSAPSTPVKSRVVRRTLSFGAQPSKGGSASSKRINRPSSLSSSSCASSCNGSGSSSKQGSSYVPIAPAPPTSSSNKCVVARPCKFPLHIVCTFYLCGTT